MKILNTWRALNRKQHRRNVVAERRTASPSPLFVRRVRQVGCSWCCIFYAVRVSRWSQVKSWTLTYTPTKARVRFDASLLADWNIQSIRPFQLPLSISLSHGHPHPLRVFLPTLLSTLLFTRSHAPVLKEPPTRTHIHVSTLHVPVPMSLILWATKRKRITRERDNIRSLIGAKRSVNWSQIEKNSVAADATRQLTIKIYSSF